MALLKRADLEKVNCASFVSADSLALLAPITRVVPFAPTESKQRKWPVALFHNPPQQLLLNNDAVVFRATKEI